ncbi:VWA domain-containing protein [Novosphingobium sp.]|uniref:vWA domain-containing protein n=1 Tax=Novosphingobium sp. TaxID=1874826 RepID=UPI00261AF912|nr:VWA domain-containing protein [Novosphingobium sp.]
MRRFSTALCTTALLSLLAGCAARQAEVANADAAEVVVTGTRVGGTLSSPMAPVTVQSAPPPPASAPATKMAQHSQWIPGIRLPTDPGREQYEGKEISPVHVVRQEPVSTFSVDVDTGAYANTRRFLSQGQLPPKDAVRTEELINYFRYDYARPERQETPFTVTTDVMTTPWNPATRLLRIGLRGYDLPAAQRPPANLVFLVDVSGSMGEPDKLPLVKSALAGLAGELGPRDRVSIVVYAGAAGVVLPPTNDAAAIRSALDRLEAGGSTAGGAGLELAYRLARDSFVRGGVNRVILATDGDFNVGVSDTKALIAMVERERDSGITLTTLGFGAGNYNEAMMEQIADHGNGNYAYIDSALEAKKVLGDEMASTLFTIAKDVKIQVEFNPAQVSQYRLLGYENRALREEDFANDKVDAGDIGAGHQVTALYEIVPTGAKGWVGPRRYDDAPPVTSAKGQAELAFVKLRYKLPDGQTSRLVEQPVPASALAIQQAPSPDFRFAAAVAAFGQKLRGDPLLGNFSLTQVRALAGAPGDFWRQEFVRLVGVAEGLGDRPAMSDDRPRALR